MVVLQWFFCVLLSVGLVAIVLRKAHKDVYWVGKHIPVLITVTFALSVLTLYAGTKHEQVDVGLVLRIENTSPNSVDLSWTRKDGSNSVDRTYYVERRQDGQWVIEKTVTGETHCSVQGFYINRDTEWRVKEVAR